MDSRTAPARLRDLPSWLVSQTAATASRLVARQLTPMAGHRWHYSMLAALAEFGPMSQAELGRRVGLDRSDVTTTLDTLTSAGLVLREPDAQDRRRNTVRISERGNEHLRELDELVGAAQDDLLAPLTTAERAELRRLLTRIVDHHAPPA